MTFLAAVIFVNTMQISLKEATAPELSRHDGKFSAECGGNIAVAFYGAWNPACLKPSDEFLP